MQTLIAVSLTTLVIMAALGAGVFLGQLYAQVKQLRRDNEDLRIRLEDANYPKRRTHADIARLEDLLTFAFDLREDVELTILHEDQQHRSQTERLTQLRQVAATISEALAETRNSPPTSFPDGPQPPKKARIEQEW